ncbi:MAG: hypothetical protein JO137_14570 [Hyphomicrobiales bacterium]|nr:hypothetical protein [Hyphomicrobiales bacterium]MBV9433041.1 hypothetical protein [Hyphomicrobiales bacterium]
MKRVAFLTAFTLPLLMNWAYAGAEPHVQAIYHNPRFGQMLEYPRDLFPITLPPPENGDGQIFTSQDGKSEVIASGSYNVDEYGRIDEVVAQDAQFRTRDGWIITYRTKGKDWAVLSGMKDDRIFYDKLLLTHHKKIINTLTVEYPVAAKAVFDPVVPRIAASFREGKAGGE